MAKAVSNRDICFIKAVSLFCEHEHFSLNIASHGLSPPTIQLGLRKTNCSPSTVLGDPEITANLYCNFASLYWEGCVICSTYLR